MAQWAVITLRVLHILSGALWVGTAFTLFWFVVPAARRAGDGDGTAYLNRFLGHRWFSTYISTAEGVAVASGLVLFWNASGGFESAWLSSPTGIAFSIGGTAAIVALVISGPISARLGDMFHLDGDDDAAAGVFQDLHRRLARTSNVYLALLVVAVVAMASARYLF